MNYKTYKSDVLIIGGGAAGCFAALELAKNENLDITLVDKGFIKRSGCLAAGVNALNAYIGDGETPSSHLEYIKKEFDGIIRDDLVYSIAERLNGVTEKIENLGLPILRDQNGNIVLRGKRSVKINGESIKPILANAIKKYKNIRVFEQIQIFDFIQDGKSIYGAYGIDHSSSYSKEPLIFFQGKKTIIATGGAAGLYKAVNIGDSKNKTWYSPFNLGAGLAMGIRAGAEMTTFEMRFVALRCAKTIAPTGTIAQGIGSTQINSKGEEYVHKYGSPTTINRLYSTIKENETGLGPCFLKTKGISKEEELNLIKAYLNMAPSQVLSWLEKGQEPSKLNVQIDSSEPYLVGGHGSAGYWVDTHRQTTLKNLYAIGDIAGGSPKKYVTGCFAEAEIASEHIAMNIDVQDDSIDVEKLINQTCTKFENLITSITLGQNIDKELAKDKLVNYETLLQEILDLHAGGISTHYKYNEVDLEKAKEKLLELKKCLYEKIITNYEEFGMWISIINRVDISLVMIEHMKSRKETRWLVYQTNDDHKGKNHEELSFVNSVKENDKIMIIRRPLVKKEDVYEHIHR